MKAAFALGQKMTSAMMSGCGCGCGCPVCKSATRTRSCCEIPEPCWMPIALGEVVCRTCPGSPAIVKFRVTNKSVTARTIHSGVTGPAAARVDFEPATLTLGAMERGVIAASMRLPATAEIGNVFEALLWIRGCRDHYLRFTVTAGTRADCCSYEFDIVDEVDHIHHWYDHFYVDRLCPGAGG
jgi:hypothetical protein